MAALPAINATKLEYDAPITLKKGPNGMIVPPSVAMKDGTVIARPPGPNDAKAEMSKQCDAPDMFDDYEAGHSLVHKATEAADSDYESDSDPVFDPDSEPDPDTTDGSEEPSEATVPVSNDNPANKQVRQKRHHNHPLNVPADQIKIDYHVPVDQLGPVIPLPVPFIHLPGTVEELRAMMGDPNYVPERFTFKKSPELETLIAVRSYIDEGIAPIVPDKSPMASQQMERFIAHTIAELVRRDGRFTCEIATDGAPGDLYLSKRLFDLIGKVVQIKTTAKIGYHNGAPAYAYSDLDKDYPGMIIILRCLEDGDTRIIPHAEIRKELAAQTVYVQDDRRSKVEWIKYKVTDDQIPQRLYEYVFGTRDVSTVKNFTRYEAMFPTAVEARIEFVNRQRFLGYLKVNGIDDVRRPVFEHARYDLMINNDPYQEKTAREQWKKRPDKTTYLSGLVAQATQSKNSHYSPIHSGTFVGLIIHFQKDYKDNLYIISEAGCLAQNVLHVPGTNIKGVSSLQFYPPGFRPGCVPNRNEWANAYLIKYATSPPDRIRDLLSACHNRQVLTYTPPPKVVEGIPVSVSNFPRSKQIPITWTNQMVRFYTEIGHGSPKRPYTSDMVKLIYGKFADVYLDYIIILPWTILEYMGVFMTPGKDVSLHISVHPHGKGKTKKFPWADHFTLCTSDPEFNKKFLEIINEAEGGPPSYATIAVKAERQFIPYIPPNFTELITPVKVQCMGQRSSNQGQCDYQVYPDENGLAFCPWHISQKSSALKANPVMIRCMGQKPGNQGQCLNMLYADADGYAYCGWHIDQKPKSPSVSASDPVINGKVQCKGKKAQSRKRCSRMVTPDANGDGYCHNHISQKPSDPPEKNTSTSTERPKLVLRVVQE